MLHRYRIGEVASMLGLKPYTLKHYENKGLIIPETDSENGYRYYTYRQVGAIIKIRNYRAMGFSIDEASAILQNDADDELSAMENRIKENCEQMEVLKRQNRILGIREASLSRCMKNLGSWEIVERYSPIPFLPHFVMGRVSDEIKEAMTEEHWNDLMEEAEIAFEFNLNRPEEPPVWGLALYGDVSPYTQLSNYSEVVPNGKRLDVFCRGPRNESMDWVVTAIKNALAASGAKPMGPALCVVNSVQASSSELSHVVTATVPLAR